MEESSHQPSSSLVCDEGKESKTRWGCVLPCWVLLINVRNGTRGYEALNWSVISYMGFAKCLGPDSKQETSGAAV